MLCLKTLFFFFLNILSMFYNYFLVIDIFSTFNIEKYYFLNFYAFEITVCKEIETNLEVPYYYWIKNYRLDFKSNTWKLLQTIENQNEINNFINGLKLIK